MFGYVVPFKSELLVRDLALYNGYYCGLCQSLQKGYGLTSRMLLNFDCTFVAVLLDALNEGKQCVKKRCPFKPLTKKRLFAPASEALDFAAALNVLLAYYKFNDDWNDEKNATALLKKATFARAASKAAKTHPALNNSIQTGLTELNALEAEGCDSIDMVANTFAGLLAKSIATAPVDDKKTLRVLHSISYNVGRWIYLVDAWHDRQRDEKNGNYNVFNINGTDEKRAQMLLEVALNQAMKAYDLLDIKANHGILDNVMYMGCFEKTRAIMNAKDNKQRRKNMTGD